LIPTAPYFPPAAAQSHEHPPRHHCRSGAAVHDWAFLEYDVSVQPRPGAFQPLIIANSEAGPDVRQRAAAFFQCDFWGPTSTPARCSKRNAPASQRTLADAQLRRAVKSVDRPDARCCRRYSRCAARASGVRRLAHMGRGGRAEGARAGRLPARTPEP